MSSPNVSELATNAGQALLDRIAPADVEPTARAYRGGVEQRIAAIEAEARAMPTGHPEATCQRCAGPNVVWSARNDLWNEVMGGEGGIVCPSCFAELARAPLEAQVATLRKALQRFVDPVEACVYDESPVEQARRVLEAQRDMHDAEDREQRA